MSRVEINAGGRHVIVEHDGGDLTYVIEKAEALWKAAQAPAHPYGNFTMQRTSTERNGNPS